LEPPLVSPLVSIVTPSYNQGRFIRATIESVLSQDYPHIEYIVMDGGSTDGTAAIVAEYAGKLAWISERDRGQAHAINKGFQSASGEIVAWLNSDDVLLPGAVRRAVEAFRRNPGVSAIYGEGWCMNREGRTTRRFPATEPFNLWKLVHLSDYVLQQSTFFRREAIERIGWLDENLDYTLDWDLLIRLGKRYGLRYVSEDFGVLREYPEAKSYSGGKRRVEEIRRVLERHSGLKRAPGYWTYGLDEYQRLWRDRLARLPRPLRIPARLLDWCFYIPTAVAIMLILRHSQGLYPDRWASDRLKWMLPELCTTVTIRGTIPDHPRLRGQELTVTAGGQELGTWRVGPGDFEVSFSRPGDRQPVFSFEIRANRYKRPRLGTELSLRRMAFILNSVDWQI